MGLIELIPLNFSMSYKAIAYALTALYFITLILFKTKTTRKMSKLVEAGGSIFLLGMCALNAFAL